MAEIDPNSSAYNPEEERLSAIDKEIQRISSADPNSIRNLANYLDSVSALGFNPYDYKATYNNPAGGARGPIEDPIGESNIAAIYAAGGTGRGIQAGGNLSEMLRSPQNVGAYREAIANYRTGKIRSLTAEGEHLARAARERRIGRLTAREAALKSQLQETKTGLQEALDADLDRDLTELGIGAGNARRQAGGMIADRGLSRSTFANQQLGDITLQEQQAKGAQRLNTSEAKAEVEKGATGVLNQIEKKRKLINQAQSLDDLASLEHLGFEVDVNQFKTNLEAELANAELDADSKAFTTQLLGGIAGAAVNIFSMRV